MTNNIKYLVFLVFGLHFSVHKTFGGSMNPILVQEGDVYVAALFPLHLQDDGTPTGECGSKLYNTGIQISTVFLKVVEEFQSRKGRFVDYSADMNLGFILIDTCFDSVAAATETTKLMKGEYGIEPKRILLILGPMLSSSTIAVATLLDAFKVPQIGYSSTTNQMSDKVQYPYYFRTVPSMTIEAETMLNMCKYMGWKYVSIIYAGDSYGKPLNTTVSSLAPKYDVCISQAINFHSYSVQEITTLLLSEKNKVKVVLLLTHRSNARPLLEYMKYEAHLQREFILFGSCNWSDKAALVEDMYGVSRGLFSLSYNVDKDESFDQYLDSAVPNDTALHPLWADYYQSVCKCSLSDNSTIPPCNSSIGITTCHGYEQGSRVPFTDKATFLSIKAIFEVHRYLCGQTHSSTCDTLTKRGRSLLIETFKSMQIGGQKVFTDTNDGSSGRRVFSMYPNKGKAPDITAIATYNPISGLDIHPLPYMEALKDASTCNEQNQCPACHIEKIHEKKDNQVIVISLAVCVSICLLVIIGILWYFIQKGGHLQRGQDSKENQNRINTEGGTVTPPDDDGYENLPNVASRFTNGATNQRIAYTGNQAMNDTQNGVIMDVTNSQRFEIGQPFNSTVAPSDVIIHNCPHEDREAEFENVSL